MRRSLLHRTYGHGAARLRISAPTPRATRRYRVRDAVGLWLEELRSGGPEALVSWLHRSAAFAVLLALVLLIPGWLASDLPAEDTQIVLVRRDPPPEPPARAEPPAPPEPAALPAAATPPLPEPELVAEPLVPAAPESRPRVSVAPIVARASVVPADLAAPRARAAGLTSSTPVVRRRGPVPTVAASGAPSRASLSLSTPASGRAAHVPDDSRVAISPRGSAIDVVPDVAARAPRPRISTPGVAGRIPREAAPGRTAQRTAPAMPAPLNATTREHGDLESVPLDALAACATDAEEDSLKQKLISAAEMRESCRGVMGSYRFLQMRNLNSFLMWVRRSPDRPVLDRCGELRLALRCLDSNAGVGER